MMQLHVIKCCCDVGFLPVTALLAGSPDMGASSCGQGVSCAEVTF